jgi:hypothetical protein
MNTIRVVSYSCDPVGRLLVVLMLLARQANYEKRPFSNLG